MNTVLVQGRIAVEKVDLLRARLDDDWRVTTWQPGDAVEAFAPLAAEADIVVGGGIPVSPWPAVPKLKLFQIPWAGHEFTSADRMPAGVPVCNTYEHESTIAEYVLLGMIESRIGLRLMDARFRAKGWAGRLPGTGATHGEIRGATVGIVGYGHIGHEVAVRARAFGMNVVGVRRSRPPCPPELDWLGTNERLDELMALSDFVVVACDLNAETRGLIDAHRLGLMKPTAVIINVARGKIIDEAALYEALKARRIGDAVIDVWYDYNEPGKPEVKPARHPFEELDNILCSGHLCGWTQEMIDRRWNFVAENIRRVMRGEAPGNLLYRGTQAQPAGTA